MQIPGAERFHVLLAIKIVHGRVVAINGVVDRSVVVGFTMQHRRLRQARLDRSRARRIRVADTHAEGGEALGRQAKLACNLVRVVADSPHVHDPKAQGFGGNRRVLCRKRRVDRRHQQHFKKLKAFMRLFTFQSKRLQTCQVGNPDQKERACPHKILVVGQNRQPRFALRVFNSDHAPGLQVRGRRCGLGRRDE